MRDPILWLGAALVVGFALPGTELQVVDVEPPARSVASVRTPIAVHFDRPVDRASIEQDAALWVFGKWSGTVEGTFEYANADRAVILQPVRPFSAGEMVLVVLSHDARGADGSALRSAGYSFGFWTRAQPGSSTFLETDRLTARTDPRQWTRAYGGIASDLNRDGWLDLTIVNEITADLRVLFNLGDGLGSFGPVIQPTYPAGATASPSEPADFDRDGNTDVCVSNIVAGTVSILLGNPNGKFDPQQQIATGTTPRGIATLDVDGDGDLDIVNALVNTGPPSMALLVNDGNGLFSFPTYFEAGVASPWGLAAGDMNEDGILDLVISSRFDEQISIRVGNGDGTFSTAFTGDVGGPSWMLGIGDVDGDGSEDVASVNSSDNTASLLLGDGQGGLSAPTLHGTDPFPLATDFGDIDGDGDLDWVTSSFDGDWWLFGNDGQGEFQFVRSFPATDSASCALLFDMDNDADLDLALIDELTDEVILQRNGDVAPPPAPPAVPAGQSGTTALTAARVDPAGARLLLSWDDTSCGQAADHVLLYGTGSQLPTTPGTAFQPSGARCGLGTSAPFEWRTAPDPPADPTRLLWFVVAASSDEVEGSWGRDSNGTERVGPAADGASGQCGVSTRDLSNTCLP